MHRQHWALRGLYLKLLMMMNLHPPPTYIHIHLLQFSTLYGDAQLRSEFLNSRDIYSAKYSKEREKVSPYRRGFSIAQTLWLGRFAWSGTPTIRESKQGLPRPSSVALPILSPLPLCS